jgi:hypothetical protein
MNRYARQGWFNIGSRQGEVRRSQAGSFVKGTGRQAARFVQGTL